MPHSIADEEFPVDTMPNKQHWGANYVLSFFDPSNGICSLLSVGRCVIHPKLWPNMSYLSLPNDRALITKGQSRNEPSPTSIRLNIASAQARNVSPRHPRHGILVRNPQAIDQSMADRLSLRINRAIATESFQRIPGTFAALPISVSCI